MRENLYINDTTNIDAVQAPSLPPRGKVAPQGRMRGGYVGELSVNGQLRQVAPHPSAGRAADTFPPGGKALYANKTAACGACIPRAAAGSYYLAAQRHHSTAFSA